MVNVLVTIPEKLNLLLERKGLSQSALARLSGFKQPQVNLWVNGKSRLYADQVIQLCRALSVSPNWLLDPDADETVLSQPDEWESKVSEIVREIGAERAWRRLVGFEEKLSRYGGVDAGGDIPDANKRGA